MNKGFTLIELMVSIAIFSVVMVVSLGALLAISAAERKAETVKSVMDNLNFALESMSRSLRTGTYYHCGVANSGPQNCGSVGDTYTTPQSYISFVDVNGNKVAYCLYTSGATGVVRRQITTGTLSTDCSDTNAFSDLTASEVKITNLAFYVKGACSKSGAEGCTAGSASPDSIQPKITIAVNGIVSLGVASSTAFTIQTSITQRVYDQ